MEKICQILHLPPLRSPTDFGPALLALRDLLRVQLANTEPTAVTLEDLSSDQCTTNVDMEKAIQILRIFYVQELRRNQRLFNETLSTAQLELVKTPPEVVE